MMKSFFKTNLTGRNKKFAYENTLILLHWVSNPEKQRYHNTKKYKHTYCSPSCKRNYFSNTKATFGLEKQYWNDFLYIFTVSAMLYRRQTRLIPLGVDQDPHLDYKDIAQDW